jgi:hypothetical protein
LPVGETYQVAALAWLAANRARMMGFKAGSGESAKISTGYRPRMIELLISC